jgi:Spy/CpxP family protein refolding chaperone
MKTTLFLTMWAAAATLALAARAQNDTPPPPAAPKDAAPRKPPPYFLPAAVLEPLQLSDEQKAKYDAIEKDYLKKRDSFKLDDTAFRKAWAERRAAEQSRDPARIAAAVKIFETERDNYRKQTEPLYQLQRDCLARFMEILTPEQAKKFDPLGKRLPKNEGDSAPGSERH